MVWIEVHQSLPTHAKTIEMATFLDVPEVEVVGHLVCLWLWAVDNAQDGQVRVDKPVVLARAAQWVGEPGRFVDALLGAGFVDQDGRLHDWDEYTGRLMERRERIQQQTRARVQAFRERRRAATGRPTPTVTRGTAQRNALQSVTGNAGNAHVTLGNAPTGPNLTKPFPSPTEKGAPDADAPDARPVRAGPAVPAVRAAPKPNKSGELIDRLAAADVPHALTGQDHAALKRTPLTAAQVAEVYVALARGEFGTEWQHDNLSVVVAIKAWAAYENAKRAPPGPPVRSRPTGHANGRTTFAQFAAAVQHATAAEKGHADELGASDVFARPGPTDRRLPAPRRD